MKTTRCSVEGCERERYARGRCRAHYDDLRCRGEVPRMPPPRERLSRGMVERPSGCVEWSGSRDRDGYGSIKYEGTAVLTHRLAWEFTNGPIPDGLNVLHHCDNPPCAQTDPTEGYPEGHLFLGTQTDNAADMIAKRRCHNQNVTHCPQGHTYDDENTYRYPDGRRKCRTCSRAADVARRARNGREAA